MNLLEMFPEFRESALSVRLIETRLQLRLRGCLLHYRDFVAAKFVKHGCSVSIRHANIK